MDLSLVARLRAEGVAVVAVTKGHGVETVRAVLGAGMADVGENYAGDLLSKAAEVPEARWHFLGTVQRRKVRDLAPVVRLWQGVARVEEGEAIARHAPGAAVLVQVNVSGLPQRNGCGWDELPAVVAGLRAMPLDVRGVMCVATTGREREQFRRLAAAADDLALPERSMGMSADWAVAVEEGATMVRLGTALFGPRPDPVQVRR